jgi:hypothetical protein
MAEAWSDYFRRRTRAARDEMAVAAEMVANEADAFAGFLERAAERGDARRRLELAAVEREISRIERRNAAKLRQPGNEPLRLERLPPLPTFDEPPPTAP